MSCRRRREEGVVFGLQTDKELLHLCQQFNFFRIDLVLSWEFLLIPEEDSGDHLINIMISLQQTKRRVGFTPPHSQKEKRRIEYIDREEKICWNENTKLLEEIKLWCKLHSHHLPLHDSSLESEPCLRQNLRDTVEPHLSSDPHIFFPVIKPFHFGRRKCCGGEKSVKCQ
jgi:hypothetical protein